MTGKSGVAAGRHITLYREYTMNQHPDFELDGFFDDDGNRYDPVTIPKPSLCVVCKMDTSEHPIESILCTLARLDHMICEPRAEFQCGSFAPREGCDCGRGNC